MREGREEVREMRQGRTEVWGEREREREIKGERELFVNQPWGKSTVTTATT